MAALRYSPKRWLPGRHVETLQPTKPLLDRGLRADSSFILTGGRGLGKTVTLRLLERELRAERRGVVVLRDLSACGGRKPEDLFLRLSADLFDAARHFLKQEKHDLELPGPPTSVVINAFDTLLHYTYDLNERIRDDYGDFSLILLLDEGEHVLRMDDPMIVLGNLRALCEDVRAGAPQLVISGFRDLRNFSKRDGTSPLKNLCTLHSLGLLPDEAANELAAPLLGRLDDARCDAYRRWLAEMAGGHPLVIQCLCAAVERTLDAGEVPSEVPQVEDADRRLLVERSFNDLLAAWDARDLEKMDRLVHHGSLNTSKISDESRAVLCYSGVAVERDDEIHAPVGLFNAWYREERGKRPRVFWLRDGALALEDCKRGIVQTRVGSTVGTAFFVDDRYLLTCEHNLYPDKERLRPRAERLELRFTVGEASGQTRVASLVQVHPHGHDLALLLLELRPDEQAPPGIQHLGLHVGTASDGAAVTTWGYPVLVEALTDQGSRVDGILLDPDTTLRGRPAMELRATQQDSSAAGLSGAPVRTDRGVVGVVSHQLQREWLLALDGVSILDGRFLAIPIQVAVEGFGLRER